MQMANTMVQHAKVGIPVSQYPSIPRHWPMGFQTLHPLTLLLSKSLPRPVLNPCLSCASVSFLKPTCNGRSRGTWKLQETCRFCGFQWDLRSYTPTVRLSGVWAPEFLKFAPLYMLPERIAVKNEWCFQQNIDHTPSEPSPQPLRL